MINRITLMSLRNGEFAQFIADVLATTKNNDPALLKVQIQYDQLLQDSISLEKLFKTPVNTALSDALLALDERRDNALNGILTLVNGYNYSTDSTIKYAAQILKKHLSVFGTGVARDNYQSETATIRSIIDDWDNMPEYDIALDALNLVTWKNELEIANNQFAKQYLARAQEAGMASPDTLKAKRLETNTAFYALRNNIDAYFTINNGAAPFGNTVASLNGLIDNYNALIARRGSSLENVPPTN